MFCESLAEFLNLNRAIRKLDISCNFIDDSHAATLKDSLINNPNIIEIDVRNNQLSEETEDEINEIITKNYLASKSIPYKKLGEYPGGAMPEADEVPVIEQKSPNPAPANLPTGGNQEPTERGSPTQSKKE